MIYNLYLQRPPLMAVGEGVRSLGPTSQRKTIEQLSAERQSKITRLKAQKEIEKKLQVWQYESMGGWINGASIKLIGW